jgi:DNA-binding response OmpR family regulator
MATKILLLEDDRLFNETIQDFLEEEGFEVDMALDPYSAMERTYQKKYDLYLFDVNLPYETGFDLLGKLRQSGDLTPAIFLTSREDKSSLSEGFAAGADDYMRKPVDLEELLLRVGAVLRRQLRREKLIVGRYSLDVVAKKLYDGPDVLDVTQKALELLILLMEAKGHVVDGETIRNRLWAAGRNASDGALRVYVTQLKKYFPENIVNVRGVGYKWVDDH